MAYYAVIDDFRVGMPQTILFTPLAPRGLACHTSEGGEGEAGALGTIRFLIDAASRNASYSEMWYPKGDGFEARRIVRPDRAAHSMNPAQPPWVPNARVRRILGDRWYDPNAFSYAVSIAGTTAGTVPRLVQDAGFMAGARRRTAELLAQFRASLAPDPLFNHGEGQADRSDWGLLMRPAILAPETDVLAQYLGIIDWTAPEFGGDVHLRAGATARTEPRFDPTNYDRYKIVTRPSASVEPFLGWVIGDPIVLSDGTVLYPSKRWAATGSRDKTLGAAFWHEADVVKIVPPSGPADCTEQVAAARAEGVTAGTTAGYADAKTKARLAVEGI